MLNKKAMAATAAAAEPVYVEDVFSTYLYAGTSANQTITNGVDLSGEGGLVWIKARNLAVSNVVFDSARGEGPSGNYAQLFTDSTTSQTADPNNGISSFNADGFSLTNNETTTNRTGYNYVSWTFRKAEKFFDVVTYTGNDTAGRQIAHNLGSVPGTIIVKCTSGGGSWAVYHRSLGNTKYLILNTTAAEATASTFWNNTDPTSTHFTVGAGSAVNTNGETYVAYLFAHDAGGFGDAGDQSVIKCGSFEETGSDVTVSLGYEPQWLLIKRTDSTSNWFLYDNMRGLGVTDNQYLQPNTSSAESNNSVIKVTATGFVASTFAGSGADWIYIAIRRGPMKTPEAGTEIYNAIAYTGNSSSSRNLTGFGFPLDLAISGRRTNAANHRVADRLRGASSGVLNQLITNTTGSEDVPVDRMLALDLMDGIKLGADSDVNVSTSTYVMWGFRRAPGFFDVVCYTGNGTSNRAIPHNLGVVPELTIVKSRTQVDNWFVTKNDWVSAAEGLILNLDNAKGSGYSWLSGVSNPTSTNFYVSSNSAANGSGKTYVMYHFASVTGVSKVGSYTGNGSSQTINCGFTAGARFVLIKRTDSTGDWVVFDSARGIVSGNDPYLELNTTDAEVTDKDAVDTDNTGFVVNETTGPNINTNGASYIFLAVA